VLLEVTNPLLRRVVSPAKVNSISQNHLFFVCAGSYIELSFRGHGIGKRHCRGDCLERLHLAARNIARILSIRGDKNHAVEVVFAGTDLQRADSCVANFIIPAGTGANALNADVTVLALATRSAASVTVTILALAVGNALANSLEADRIGEFPTGRVVGKRRKLAPPELIADVCCALVVVLAQAVIRDVHAALNPKADVGGTVNDVCAVVILVDLAVAVVVHAIAEVINQGRNGRFNRVAVQFVDYTVIVIIVVTGITYRVVVVVLLQWIVRLRTVVLQVVHRITIVIIVGAPGEAVVVQILESLIHMVIAVVIQAVAKLFRPREDTLVIGQPVTGLMGRIEVPRLAQAQALVLHPETILVLIEIPGQAVNGIVGIDLVVAVVIDPVAQVISPVGHGRQKGLTVGLVGVSVVVIVRIAEVPGLILVVVFLQRIRDHRAVVENVIQSVIVIVIIETIGQGIIVEVGEAFIDLIVAVIIQPVATLLHAGIHLPDQRTAISGLDCREHLPGSAQTLGQGLNSIAVSICIQVMRDTSLRRTFIDLPVTIIVLAVTFLGKQMRCLRIQRGAVRAVSLLIVVIVGVTGIAQFIAVEVLLVGIRRIGAVVVNIQDAIFIDIQRAVSGTGQVALGQFRLAEVVPTSGGAVRWTCVVGFSKAADVVPAVAAINRALQVAFAPFTKTVAARCAAVLGTTARGFITGAVVVPAIGAILDTIELVLAPVADTIPTWRHAVSRADERPLARLALTVSAARRTIAGTDLR